MKFLFHTVTLGQTGGARVLINLSDALLKKGHEVTIIIDRKHIAYAVPDGLIVKYLTPTGLKDVQSPKTDVISVGQTSVKKAENKIKKFLKPLSKGFKWLKYVLKLLLTFPLKYYWVKRYVNKYMPDLVATHNMYQDYEHLFYYKSVKNFYLVVHNSPKEVFFGRDHFKVFPFSWYLKNINVICVSHESETEYKDIFENAKTLTIYNPLDFESIRLKSEEAIPYEHEHSDYILVVASLGERKRVDRVLRLLSKLDDNLELVILGDGPLKSELRDLALELGIADRVVFLGYDSNPYKYMKSAKALVLTADSEGLGMVLVEALVSGVIPVSLDCPVGPREVLVGDLSPFLVPMRDKNEEKISEALFEAAKLALNTKLNSLNYKNSLQRFDQNHIVQQWEDLARAGS